MDWIAGAVYEIAYRNREGLETRRIIRVIETILIKRNITTVYIRAFCYLRNEDRTFREDRITQTKLIAKQEAAAGASIMQTPVTALSVKRSYEANTVVKDLGKPIFSDTYQTVNSHYANATMPVLKHESFPSSKMREENSKPSQVAPYSDDYFSRSSKQGHEELDHRTKKKSNIPRIIGITLAIVLGFVFVYGNSNASTDRTQSNGSAKTAALAQQLVRPSIEEVKLGGCILRIHTDSTGTWYEVPARNFSSYNKADAVAAIRVPNFKSYTGIKDPALIAKYLAADRDGNGKLSYVELEYFAYRQRTYVTYKNNETALRPDVFLAEGGGDCEDFALYIAGLLRFWGWQPYIACFDPPEGYGHAVCFSYEGSGGFPSSYTYYTLKDKVTWDGTVLPDGKYIPIDFENVGKLSNAVGADCTLNDIFIPEKIWGIRM